MRIAVVTLFPEFFTTPLGAGLIHRAQERGLVEFRFVNPRDFTHDRHRTVDDYAYGGGPGIILRPEPMVDAVESLTGAGNPAGAPVILLSPAGGDADAIQGGGALAARNRPARRRSAAILACFVTKCT